MLINKIGNINFNAKVGTCLSEDISCIRINECRSREQESELQTSLNKLDGLYPDMEILYVHRVDEGICEWCFKDSYGDMTLIDKQFEGDYCKYDDFINMVKFLEQMRAKEKKKELSDNRPTLFNRIKNWFSAK